MRAFGVLALGWLGMITGCGSSSVKQTSQAPQPIASSAHTPTRLEASRSPSKTEAEPARSELPRACTNPSGACYPPPEFVRALCKKKYPSVSLAMFDKGRPWQHAYVKVKEVAPLNSLGGPSGFASLEFLEEVVILREREIKRSQMITDIPTSYDVLRLDGTCATLAVDEFMTKKPYVLPRYAPVIWEQIDATMRDVLHQNAKVDQAALAQTAACRGSYLAGGGEPCKAATQQLARAIVAALTEGMELPVPANLPSWSVAEGSVKPSRRVCPVNHTC